MKSLSRMGGTVTLNLGELVAGVFSSVGDPTGVHFATLAPSDDIPKTLVEWSEIVPCDYLGRKFETI